MAEKYGQDEVEVWRRSFDVPPPKLDVHDSRHPSFDPRYKHIDPELLPTSESLSDLVGRIKPLWEQSIKPKIQENKKILIVAHGSSIRALIYLLDHINSEDIKNVDIPNGTPIIYTLNTDLTPITHEYLGDESEIQNRMDRIKNETKTIEVE
jgi:2,3-bisphosphoglycerate-dependent phosphoglycerate mutase